MGFGPAFDRMRTTTWGRAVRIVLLLVLAFAVAHGLACIEVWRYSSTDETRRADVAIVLGAQIFGEEPSPVFAARIDHGIWLYQEGYVNQLVMTGGTGLWEQASEASVARAYAVANGVPEEDVLIEEASRVTYTNLINAQQVMESHGHQTALVVSDPLHMRRSMAYVEVLGLEAWPSPTPTTRYQTWRTKGPFLVREGYYLTWFELGHLLGIV